MALVLMLVVCLYGDIVHVVVAVLDVVVVFTFEAAAVCRVVVLFGVVVGCCVVITAIDVVVVGIVVFVSVVVMIFTYVGCVADVFRVVHIACCVLWL